MQKIKLMFEFGHGPIWNSEPFTGKLMSGIEVVDSDPDLELWNRNAWIFMMSAMNLIHMAKAVISMKKH